MRGGNFLTFILIKGGGGAAGVFEREDLIEDFW